MKQNKKKSGNFAIRVIAFVLLGAMVLSAVVMTAIYFMESLY